MGEIEDLPFLTVTFEAGGLTACSPTEVCAVTGGAGGLRIRETRRVEGTTLPHGVVSRKVLRGRS